MGTGKWRKARLEPKQTPRSEKKKRNEEIKRASMGCMQKRGIKSCWGGNVDKKGRGKGRKSRTQRGT